MFDIWNLSAKIVKYIFEGVIVAAMIPKKSNQERMMLALLISTVLVLLDLYLPSIAISVRTGIGFGIGANLVGFPKC
jgi:hypothetical protein